MDVSKTDPNETEGTTDAIEDEREDSPDDNNDESMPLNGGDLDEDSMECVICLTDPREVSLTPSHSSPPNPYQVVVYPCRHMCMCSSCATAIPSQVMTYVVVCLLTTDRATSVQCVVGLPLYC